MELGVNIDHIATLRNARGGIEPSVIEAAKVSEKAGAVSITVHLREDRRHIKDEDVIELKKVLNIKMNLEMAMTEEMCEIALRVKPYSCCLVPEKRKELTTEGGLDVASSLEYSKKYVQKLKEAGIIVSLFIDPDKAQIEAAQKTTAQYIELHTGSYANQYGTEKEEEEFLRLKNAAKLAQSLNLKVNVGHGLNYDNVIRMKDIFGLFELNIGHSIISRAIFVGLESAVIEMNNLIK